MTASPAVPGAAAVAIALPHPWSSHTEAGAVRAGDPFQAWSEVNVQRVMATVMGKTVLTVQMWMQVGLVAGLDLKLEPGREAGRLHLLGLLLFLGQRGQEQQDQQHQHHHQQR